MKKFISKQKNCFIALLGLVALSETLLNIDNKFIQFIGILFTPFIAILVYLLIRNDQKDYTNKKEA